MSETRSPAMPEVIRGALELALREVRVWLPGKVTRYDAQKQAVDVQPLVGEAYEDEEGARQTAALPVIPSVPVVTIGGGGFRMTLPLAQGDTGALLFSASSLDRWLAGTGGAVDDPEIDVRHGLGDACFVPGLKPFGAPWKSAPTDHATLGADEGVQVHFRNGTICIGDESGSKALALDGDGLTASTKLATWALAIENGVVAGGGAAPPVRFADPTGPGGTGGALGTVVGSATQAKGK